METQIECLQRQNAELLEAAKYAQKVLQENRHRMPKSVKNGATFSYLLATGTLSKAIRNAS